MNNNYNTLSIPVRTYSKYELAHIYFPQSTPQVAVNQLMKWIKQAPDLMAQLESAGYKRCSKMLTPKQVRMIIEAFGEPD